MKRRSGTGGQRAKGKSRRPVLSNARKAGRSASNGDLQGQINALTLELKEEREQRTAASEILKIISSSPGELDSVFNTILANATHLCEATWGNLFLREGPIFRSVAVNSRQGHIDSWRRNPVFDLRENPGVPLDRVANTKQVLHITDLRADQSYIGKNARVVTLVEVTGARTYVSVPMLSKGELIGAISLFRQKVRSFTGKQIELVQGFAAQAVIAIENTRLLNELRQRTDDLSEALEQQTATSEVLQVISSSPAELEPVFQTILENATRLCAAKFGTLYLREGESFRTTAMHNVPPAFAEVRRRNPLIHPEPGSLLRRLVDTKKAVHAPDVTAEPAYIDRQPRTVTAVELGGFRSMLAVPMLKDGYLVGAVVIYRQEISTFSNKQIELVQNFAAQAVIAIENARLLNELRRRTDDLSEALEQQTATSEVLKVISSSPTNVQPVFDSIAESAVRLCNGQFSFVVRFDGKAMEFASCYGLSAEGLAAFQSILPMPASEDTAAGRAISRRAVVEIPDVRADLALGARSQRLAKTVTYRSIAAVPLLQEGNPIGAIAVARAHAGSFPERQMALLQAFADQAVIAIENVRLFDEVQARTRDLSESLQQQTATADVLKVISRSTFDLKRVLRTLTESAAQLCEAQRAMVTQRGDDGLYQFVASFGFPEEFEEYMKQNPLTPGRATTTGRVALEGKIVHIPDVLADREYVFPKGQQLGGYRSNLGVPLLRDGNPIGAFVLTRPEVKPFTPKQIELVETFADQAVIAIENARLLNELRESLQQQTATADVLKVISRSTFDLKAVLTNLVETAVRVCEADIGNIARPIDGDTYKIEANFGQSTALYEELARQTLKIGKGSVIGRTALSRAPVHILDAQTDPDYELRAAREIGDYHTMLGVPMVREGNIIGVFGLARNTVRAFTEKQIELVTTFADQAVIAIENVRLFESVEARTRELAQSLDNLRTTQDRLVQTEKLASLGQLTAGIAHEIKNPLNFVNNFSGVSAELIDELQNVLSGLTVDQQARSEINELTDTLRSNLDKVVQHGKRADAIVKNMLLHSREGSGEHRVVDINALVEESLNLAYHGARAEKQGFNITMERSLDPAAGEVDLFPQDITRVLLNLISNGFYAATKRKTQADHDGYEPTLAASTRSLGDQVEIRIRDNGTGIPPEVKEKMFNPFFTTKPAGEGTGLGLSISHDIIVKQHGGAIEVDTEPGEYTEFRIVLPRKSAIVGKIGGVG